MNPSPKESVLRYVETPAAVPAWTLRPPAKAATVEVDERPSRRRALEQHIWWWLLLAATACLVLESGLLLTRRGEAVTRLDRGAA